MDKKSLIKFINANTGSSKEFRLKLKTFIINLDKSNFGDYLDDFVNYIIEETINTYEKINRR